MVGVSKSKLIDQIDLSWLQTGQVNVSNQQPLILVLLTTGKFLLNIDRMHVLGCVAQLMSGLGQMTIHRG